MVKHTNRLRVLRAEKDLTQLDTAFKSGISTYRYWRIENGYELPREKERKALTRLFKADPFAVPEAVAS